MKGNKDKTPRDRELSNNNPRRKSRLPPEADETKKKIAKEETSPSKIPSISSNLNLYANNLATSNSLSLSQSFLSNPQNSTGNIRVVCRFRPLNEKEKEITKDVCVDFLDDLLVELHSKAENNNYKFSFDRTFNPTSTQQEIYEFSARPLVESVLEGFNGTIFAYGQTSSGKTFTMQGVLDNPEKEGIIPRMIRHIFHHILCSNSDIEYTVKVAMIEIYMEKIRDLIDTSKSNLNVRENKSKGIYIEDLSEHYVSNEDDMMEYIRVGSENRTVAATNCNENSSRSHSIFIMTIHQNNVKDLIAKTGKLYLVDLAGSEKIAKTGATGNTLDEAKMINKSLTTLGMVINALTDGKSTHIPYRESKLTRVLQESLGGNAKTALIIACSPSSYNECETLSTLRFGMRAKKIKNKPKINKEVTVAELKIEIDKLERLLVICNNRIVQLEKFCVKNNLVVPMDGDMSFMKDEQPKVTALEKEIEQIKEEDMIIDSNIRLDTLNLNSEKDDDMLEDHHSAKSDHDNDFLLEKLDALNEIKLKEIAEKYTEVMTQMNHLEDEKKDLNDKLDDALVKISDLQASLDQKEKIEEEMATINSLYNNAVSDLNEKIKLIQEREVIERNRIIVPSKNESHVETLEGESQTTAIENEIELEDICCQLKEYITKKMSCKDKDHAVQEMQKNMLGTLGNMINHLNNNEGATATNFNELLQIATPSPMKAYGVLNVENISEFAISYDKEREKEIKDKEIMDREIKDKDMPKLVAQTEESIKKERKKFEKEKKLILKTLQEKNDKISSMEGEQRELKDRVKLIESTMTPEDKNLIKKILGLEKNLEQVNLMYHQVVTQKSVLKIENQVLEKKIKKRNEKLLTLDKENFDLKEQLKMRDDKLSFYQKSHIKGVGGPQVVKVLRGLGGNNRSNDVTALTNIPEKDQSQLCVNNISSFSNLEN